MVQRCQAPLPPPPHGIHPPPCGSLWCGFPPARTCAALLPHRFSWAVIRSKRCDGVPVCHRAEVTLLSRCDFAQHHSQWLQIQCYEHLERLLDTASQPSCTVETVSFSECRRFWHPSCAIRQALFATFCFCLCLQAMIRTHVPGVRPAGCTPVA